MNKEDIYKCLKWPLSSNGTALEGRMPINNLGDLNEFIIKHFKKIILSDEIDSMCLFYEGSNQYILIACLKSFCQATIIEL